MKEGHKYLTVFDTSYKFQYVVMELSLANFPAVFINLLITLFPLDKYLSS